MKSLIRCGSFVLAAVLFFFCTQTLQAAEFVKADVEVKQESKTLFLQIKKGAKNEPISMQTAIVRYAQDGKTDVSVDLVSVVHIADRRYYKQLDLKFKEYDCVLYELVAPKGTIPQPGQKSDNPLAMVQKIMMLLLQLDHQIECVDYTPNNFVHADMSPKEMQEAMKKRGETPLTLFLSIVLDMLRKQNMEDNAPQEPAEGFDPFELISDPYGPWKMKVTMANQMADQVNSGSGLGQTIEALLIDDRNEKCMKVLDEQIKAGKRRIAIFYGAAHNPDFETRLQKTYGMKPMKTEWLDAWDLKRRPVNTVEVLLQIINELNK